MNKGHWVGLTRLEGTLFSALPLLFILTLSASFLERRLGGWNSNTHFGTQGNLKGRSYIEVAEEKDGSLSS